ncbi:MAG: sulfotransferase family protein [Pseudooceanicola sp.]
MGQQFVFVTGVPRSGTSALAEMLTLHPEVAVMHERFGGMVDKNGFGPGLYTAERVGTYLPDDGGSRAFNHAVTQQAIDKWPPAKVVGDKIPALRNVLKQAHKFKGCKIIAIVRDPFSVSASYQARAGNRSDPWPATKNHAAAISHWNSGLNVLLEAVREKELDIHIVGYNDLFVEGKGREEIFEFIGVCADKGIAATAELFESLPQDKKIKSRVSHQVTMRCAVGLYRTLLSEQEPGGKEKSQPLDLRAPARLHRKLRSAASRTKSILQR